MGRGFVGGEARRDARRVCWNRIEPRRGCVDGMGCGGGRGWRETRETACAGLGGHVVSCRLCKSSSRSYLPFLHLHLHLHLCLFSRPPSSSRSPIHHPSTQDPHSSPSTTHALTYPHLSPVPPVSIPPPTRPHVLTPSHLTNPPRPFPGCATQTPAQTHGNGDAWPAAQLENVAAGTRRDETRVSGDGRC